MCSRAIWLAVHFVKRYFFEKVLQISRSVYPSLSYSLLGVKEVLPRERGEPMGADADADGWEYSFFVYSFWGLFFLVVVSVIRSVMDDYLLRMLRMRF